MNELRGRLDNIIWDNLEAVDTDYGHPIVKGHDKAIDAILDAVITALPEKGAHVYDDSTIESQKHRAGVEGYNYALTAMKDVLQAAKENK